MTTTETISAEKLERLSNNLAKVEELSRRLVAALSEAEPPDPQLSGPDPSLWAEAARAYWQTWFADPARLWQTQAEYWADSVRNFIEIQSALARGEFTLPAEDGKPADRRFSHPMWETHPYFRLLRDQYLATAEAVRKSVDNLEGLDPKERKRLRYFTEQIVQMLSPTNFLATNPEALERALETDGESLIKGLENLVEDLEASKGQLYVRLADEKAFRIGENIATTPGEVIYRNRMMEVIQYAPATEQVHEIPIVLFPPWINKYYILDLRPENSLIRWIVNQGYTLFVVSWVNPDPSYRDVGMDQYVEEGFLEAIRVARKICGTEQVNAVGYCIAGTTLALTLSLLRKRGEKPIKSATFLTALTDFSDQGEFTPFLQDDFVDGIEEEVEREGILRSIIMARTFSFLRSSDLIYQPAVRKYLMGEPAPAFDLLFWNGDGTNLPAKMVMEYLRGLCQQNLFVTEGFPLLGEKVHIKDVTVPLMAVTCESDHIAAWKSCYRGVQQMGARSKSFVVSESGHIAGIVNPPGKDKYGHYFNKDLKLDPDEWLAGAEYRKKSWWPRWEAWLKPRAGKLVPARAPGSADYPPLAPAPGTYVLRKAVDAAG